MHAGKRAPPAPWYHVLVATGVVCHQPSNVIRFPTMEATLHLHIER